MNHQATFLHFISLSKLLEYHYSTNIIMQHYIYVWSHSKFPLSLSLISNI